MIASDGLLGWNEQVPAVRGSDVGHEERLKAGLADRYQIEREIGSGGMATVYLAQDLKHNRKVAVKVLDPHLAAAVGPDRFLQEIQIAAGLTHPHILSVHDSGEAASLLFFVMPYVEGESLRTRLKREGSLPLEVALQITREVAEALAHAHRQGILHRDIKPENILLSSGGAVVADFGIARSLHATADGRLTATGSSLGTPLYMSPEQAAGELELDGRSDLYALGCILHEMLTGEPPFSGLSAGAVMARKIAAEVPPFRKARGGVSEELEAVVLKALARERVDRFETVDDFEQALSAGLPPADWRRRAPAGKWLNALAASAAVAVVGLGGWWGLGILNPPPSPERLLVLAPELTGDALRDAYVEDLHRDLIRSMGSVSGLSPLSRATALSLRERNLPIAEVAAEVEVGSVVVLTARYSTDSLFAEVEVWTAAEEMMWAETMGEPIEALRQLPNRLALAVAQHAGTGLTGSETTRLTRIRRVVPAAYEAYVLGQHALEQPPTSSGLEQAIEHFHRAIGLDSMFVDACAALAIAHKLQGDFHFRRGTDAFTDARRYAERALALDSMVPEAYAALAQARLRLDWDWEGAERSFVRALDLNPNLADAHWDYGYMLSHLRRWDEALSEMRTAVSLAPLNQDYLYELGVALAESGAFDEGLQVLDTARSKYPDFIWAPIYRAYAYAAEGRWAEAVAQYETGLGVLEREEQPIQPALFALAGQAYAKAGNRDRAESILRELEGRFGSQEADDYVPPDYVGVLCIALGEHDLGMEWVQRAYEDREPGLLFLTTPWLYADVESHPVYQEILRSVFGEYVEHPPP
jgi:serine/threonine-protein kinase